MRVYLGYAGLLGVAVVGLAACGLSIFAEPKTNPVIEDRVGRIGSQPVGTLATTAERRIVLVRIDPEDKKTFGRFCSEPPPDAAENIANSLTFAVQAAVKTPEAEGSGRLELAKQLATTVQSLFHRSQGLQLYRDGLYNLCMAWVNGVVNDGQEFTKRADALLNVAQTLIAHELEKTNGIIGGPPPVPGPQITVVDEGSTIVGGRPRLESDRIRAHTLVNDYERVKKDFERAGRTGQQQAEDRARAKVTLIQLHEILVLRNRDNPDLSTRTLSDEDMRGVLGRLVGLARANCRDQLAIPAKLNKTDAEFLKNFNPPEPGTACGTPG
ncbi:MAG: hypothetical protein HYY46_22115 [Deltaproteobacteria bacterium]|nr:hypothetical protein [Deltaproteobacteria bacterium]